MSCPKCGGRQRVHGGMWTSRKGQRGRYMFWKCLDCNWIVKQKGDGWLAIG